MMLLYIVYIHMLKKYNNIINIIILQVYQDFYLLNLKYIIQNYIIIVIILSYIINIINIMNKL